MVITGCELDVICASLVVYLSSVSQCASNLGGLRTVKVFETALFFFGLPILFLKKEMEMQFLLFLY